MFSTRTSLEFSKCECIQSQIGVLQVICLLQQKDHTITFDFVASLRSCFFPLQQQQHTPITTITTTTTTTIISTIVIVLSEGASVGAVVAGGVVGGRVEGATVGSSSFSFHHRIHQFLPVSITKMNFVEIVSTVRMTEKTLSLARS